MRCIIRDDPTAAAAFAAEFIVDKIATFVPTPQKRNFVLGLSTAKEVRPVYAHLVQAYRAGRLSFKHVVTFLPDTFVSLPMEHPESTHAVMYDALFAHVDLAPTNVHIPDGSASCLAEEVARFEAAVAENGSVDVALMSLRELRNGHRGLSSDSEGRSSVADGFFHDQKRVLRLQLHAGGAAMAEARRVLALATGTAISREVRQCVESNGNYVTGCSFPLLNGDDGTLLVVDDDATVNLKVGTVRAAKRAENRSITIPIDASVTSQDPRLTIVLPRSKGQAMKKAPRVDMRGGERDDLRGGQWEDDCSDSDDVDTNRNVEMNAAIEHDLRDCYI